MALAANPALPVTMEILRLMANIVNRANVPAISIPTKSALVILEQESVYVA